MSPLCDGVTPFSAGLAGMARVIGMRGILLHMSVDWLHGIGEWYRATVGGPKAAYLHDITRRNASSHFLCHERVMTITSPLQMGGSLR